MTRVSRQISILRRRLDKTINSIPNVPRAGRGTSPSPYRDISVYVWNVGGNPGGRDAGGAIIPTTLIYRCEWPNGKDLFTRVDNDGNYTATANYRLTTDAPAQPMMQQRWPGVEYVPAPNRSIATGFSNENGDFVLKTVLELPLVQEACQ